MLQNQFESNVLKVHIGMFASNDAFKYQ